MESDNIEGRDGDYGNEETGVNKVRFPISLKLISVISVIVILSLLAVTVVATYFFRSDNKIRAMEDTLNYSTLISKKVKADLKSITERGRLAAVNLQGKGSGGSRDFAELLFSGDPDLLFIGVMVKKRPGDMLYMQNENYFQGKGGTPDFRGIIRKEYDTVSRSFFREDVVFNPSIHFGEPVIGISVPYDPAVSDVIIVIFYSMNAILESINSAGIISSFIVSGNGDIIAHMDRDLVMSKSSYSTMPVIAMMMTNPNPNAQTSYTGDDGERYLGSFSRVGFSDAAVISFVREDRAFAMVYRIQRIIMWLTGIVLSAAFLINLFFSRTLTRPIRSLTRASRDIGNGNYDLEISSSSKDELGVLTGSFMNMARGLKERERIKSAFGKFVNRQVANLVSSGEVKLGGERKDVAVFFSDIRSFTRMAEAMSPEDVVGFLNSYMTRMVGCVNRTRGVVDKFIGDAIMAVWGAPVSTGDDAFNAVNAALLMREQLIEFNKSRGTVKRPSVSIGCGIHYGPALAGQIGSEDRMEYTVIGDTVNIASRIEALNKPFFTDILVSEEIASMIDDRFRLFPMQKIRVKGKSKPLQIYAVLGRLANRDSPKTLDELRKLIGTYNEYRRSGTKKTATGKEKKYEILD
ncbi:MAG TPA: adenylate/guanylate cyclase domain-containing protein [Spirochaetota bacterium]|nr:adenylate/guanylate cyclase domain-containing protein [Spirochaetota bacterium]HPJ35486.1 adenylate/guanylate cyclase domain-containing protein [Spirochaetota bacterium]